MIPCSIELSNMYFCLIQEMTPRSIGYLLLQTNKIIIIMKLEANSALFQYVRNKRGSKRLNWNCHLHSYVQGLNHLSKLTRLRDKETRAGEGKGEEGRVEEISSWLPEQKAHCAPWGNLSDER